MPLMIERSDRAPRSANFRRFLRTCLRSLEQQLEEGQVDHLQAGVQLTFAVFP